MFKAIIDLGALKRNIGLIKNNLNTKLCLVVKADAYGHGEEAVTKYIKDDIDEFAVATLDEALRLNEYNLNKPINILGCTDFDSAPDWEHLPPLPNIIPTICDKSELPLLKNAEWVNIKVNTGMNRLGVRCEQLSDLADAVKKSRKQIKSIFTHLYNAVDTVSMTEQVNLFQQYVLPLKVQSGGKIELHCCASNSFEQSQNMQFDMSRIGIAAYGYYDGIADLSPVMSISTSILQVFDVKAGEHVSYGDFVIDKDTRLAAIRAGYADGYRRRQPNETRFVAINGVLCEIVGQVCMDITMVDVSKVLLSGKERVYILGGGADGRALAASYNTIIYEVLTGFSRSRIRREYIE